MKVQVVTVHLLSGIQQARIGSRRLLLATTSRDGCTQEREWDTDSIRCDGQGVVQQPQILALINREVRVGSNRNANENTAVILVGNKVDVVEKRQVTYDEGYEFGTTQITQRSPTIFRTSKPLP